MPSTPTENGEDGEDAYVVVNDLKTNAPMANTQASLLKRVITRYGASLKKKERSVSFKADKLFDENLEHIGKLLQQTPFTYAHRSETTLRNHAHRGCARKENIEKGRALIWVSSSQQSYDDTFHENSGPFGRKPIRKW